MLQRYKLRLGDGTVLGVDHEGLKTWALDGNAMVQAAASHRWYPLKAFLAAERAAAARRATRLRPSGREARPTPGPLPLVYPKPRVAEGPPPEEAVPEAVPFLSEASPVEALAEPVVGLIDPNPQPIPEPEVVPVLARTLETPTFPSPEPLLVPAEPWVAPVAEPPVPAAPEPGYEPVQAWGDEPALEDLAANALLLEEDFTDRADVEQDWISDDDLSPLPPLDEVDAAPIVGRDPVEPLGAGPSPGGGVPEGAPPSPLPRPSLQVLADDLAPERQGPAAPGRNPSDDLPIIPLKPLDDETEAATQRATSDEGPGEAEVGRPRNEMDETLTRWFVRGIAAYDVLLTRWIYRLKGRPASTSSIDSKAARGADEVGRPLEPEPPILEPPGEAERSAREPLSEPLPIRELPILPFAAVEAPEEVGEVYETEGRLSGVGRSARRIVVTSALLAGSLLAAFTGKAWLPRAEQLGQAALSEIDRIQQGRENAERQRQALQEATERLPHLAPQTIRLLMANDPTGILDPPEMFRIASDAADRGKGALDSQEAREMEELRRDLLAALRPSERARVQAYDAARARRLVFPFEGQDALDLVGRGVYTLPPESRARLQDLYAKAIAAGLPAPPQSAGP